MNWIWLEIRLVFSKTFFIPPKKLTMRTLRAWRSYSGAQQCSLGRYRAWTGDLLICSPTPQPQLVRLLITLLGSGFTWTQQTPWLHQILKKINSHDALRGSFRHLIYPFITERRAPVDVRPAICLTLARFAGVVHSTRSDGSGYIQIIFRLYTGYIQMRYILDTNYIQIRYRLYSNLIQDIFTLYTGYIQIIFRLDAYYI